MTALVAYLVPPGIPRCPQWGKAVILATGHVSNRGCFACFLGPQEGAPAEWLQLPPKEEMPSVSPVRVEPGSWAGPCGNEVATFVCWEQEKRLDTEKVAGRVLAALAWWGAR